MSDPEYMYIYIFKNIKDLDSSVLENVGVQNSTYIDKFMSKHLDAIAKPEELERVKLAIDNGEYVSFTSKDEWLLNSDMIRKIKVTSEIDQKIQEAIIKFLSSQRVVDLPKGLVLRAWANQKEQGNTPTSEIELVEEASDGNFTWADSKEGQTFWQTIYEGDWFSDEVLKVLGSKEAFFENPDQSQKVESSEVKSKRIKELTQDEIQEYFDTDGKSASPSTKRLATGIDPKYTGYLILDQFGYRIEIVSKEDGKLSFSGPWFSYKPKSLINEFLRLNSPVLTQMMNDDLPLFDAFNNVISVLRSKYEPESDIRQQEEVVIEKSGWRVKTKNELEKDKLGDLGISPTVLNAIYGKPLEDLFETKKEVENAIKILESDRFIDSIRFFDGIAKGYGLTKYYFTKKPIIEEAQEEQWRFKTLDEIDADGLDYAGLDKRDISKYTGKLLTELNLRYPVEEIVKDIKNNISVNVDGYTFRSKYFTTKPLPAQQTQKPEPVKKEWTPEDLVGKILLFNQSGKKFLVEKFTRNNPKNKEYKLRDLSSPSSPEVTYRIAMTLVVKWLDGKSASGVKIVEDEPKTGDYSTWTQGQLKAKRKEISDAMVVFEEEDPEYKELKDQLDIIDTFID